MKYLTLFRNQLNFGLAYCLCWNVFSFFENRNVLPENVQLIFECVFHIIWSSVGSICQWYREFQKHELKYILSKKRLTTLKMFKMWTFNLIMQKKANFSTGKFLLILQDSMQSEIPWYLQTCSWEIGSNFVINANISQVLRKYFRVLVLDFHSVSLISMSLRSVWFHWSCVLFQCFFLFVSEYVFFVPHNGTYDFKKNPFPFTLCASCKFTIVNQTLKHCADLVVQRDLCNSSW